jgi:hypothetical protein
MFDIFFTGEVVHDEGVTLHLGAITLGAHEEAFGASCSFWSQREYQQQWLEAARRLLEPSARSAFITHMDDPATESVINWWPTWRIDSLIILQNHLLFPGAKPGEDEYNPLTARFSLEDPYAALGDRDSGHSEECQRTNICRRTKLGSREIVGEVCCSEWCVTVEAVKDFLERRIKDWT